NVSAYTDTGVTNGVTYYYVVTAVNGIGESDPSGEASATPTAGPTAPDAPQSLHASPGNGTVSLTWSAPGFDGGSALTGYRLYRGTTSGGTTLLVTVAGGNDSYADGGLTNGQAYYYRVSAVNRVGEGALSVEASATPSSGPAVPASPQNLVATAGNRAVTLRWY